MDVRTARAAIQLQLADIAELLDSLYQDNVLPEGDERASLETIRNDLTKQLMLLGGQVLVIKILKDEYNARVTFKKLLEDEKQAVSDHQLALRLAGITIGPADTMFNADDEVRLREAEVHKQVEQWNLAKDLYTSAFQGMDGEKSVDLVESRTVQPLVANRAPLHGTRIASAE